MSSTETDGDEVVVVGAAGAGAAGAGESVEFTAQQRYVCKKKSATAKSCCRSLLLSDATHTKVLLPLISSLHFSLTHG